MLLSEDRLKIHTNNGIFFSRAIGRMFGWKAAMILIDQQLHTTDFEIKKSRSEDWNEGLQIQSKI